MHVDLPDNTDNTLRTTDLSSASLSQRIDDAFLQHLLHLMVVWGQVRPQRLVEDEVEDSGEVEHGEESGIQVARVVVTLDPPLLAAHYRQLLGAVHVWWADVTQNIRGFQCSKFCTIYKCI